MIDLHLHSTASDGTLDPGALVIRAHGAGIRTLSLTDHDTMAGVQQAADKAASLGLEFLPGVEITAVLERKDVHILGYFLDASPPGLEPFLRAQREDRMVRARKMASRLAELGVPIDIEAIIEQAEAADRAVARPLLAQSLVQAGHVSTEREAFDRWLGDEREAYEPRQGSSPGDVVRLISRAGGVSALAHPGLLGREDLIPSLAKAGLGALEVYHSDHDRSTQEHYTKLADQHGLAASGGSDFHGDGHHRAKYIGTAGPPREAFVSLLQLLLHAHSVVHSQ